MAEPNGLNPSFQRFGLPGNVWWYAGTAYSDATIKAEVGTAGTSQAAGSVYIGNDTGTPGMWVLVTTTWTKKTIN
jgi:hypothetical protein